jgi:spore coat protein U-like protein
MIFPEHEPAEHRLLRPLLRCMTMLAFATLAWASGNGAAMAQTCSATVTGGAYGTINVLTGSAIASSTSLAISCAGTPRRSVRLCVEIEPGTIGSAGQRILSGPGATLNHEIFSDPGRTRAWGSWALTGTGYGSGGVQVDLTLGASTGTATQVLTLYDMISASQTTALPGDYVWTGTTPGLSYAYFNGRSCPLAGAK